MNHGVTTALTLEDDLGEILWTSIPTRKESFFYNVKMALRLGEKLCNQVGETALGLCDPPKSPNDPYNNVELPSNSASKWRYQVTFRKIIKMSDDQPLINNGLVKDKNSMILHQNNGSRESPNGYEEHWLSYYCMALKPIFPNIHVETLLEKMKRERKEEYKRWLFRKRILTNSPVLSEDEENSKKRKR